jgi:hypothetical protein
MIDIDIPSPNFVAIRNQIAAVLQLELNNQVEEYERDDLDVDVYVDRLTPVGQDEVDSGKSVISVIFAEINPTGKTNDALLTSNVFFIDVTAGAKGGDSEAKTKNLNIVGAIIYILTNQRYKSLGFEDTKIIGSINIDRIQSEIEYRYVDSFGENFSRIQVTVKTTENTLGFSGKKCTVCGTEFKIVPVQSPEGEKSFKVLIEKET